MIRKILLQARISKVRRTLVKPNGPGDENWTADRIDSWLQALGAIKRAVNGDRSIAGFSIVRSLDASEGTTGRKSEALLELAGHLRRAGIKDFR